MKYLLLFLSFLTCNWAIGQADTIKIDSVRFELKKEITQAHDYFSIDNLGNIYLVNHDQIFKYNPQGELLYKQSFKNMGDITSIDASQSLRTLIYYRDLTQIIFVDNTLSLQGESIKLEKDNYEFTTLTCASFVNNQFWIYRTDEFIIERIDKQLNKIVTSSNIVQIKRKEINPNFLVEANELVFLNNPEDGILVFDIFGTYIQTIPIPHLKDFQVLGDKILYADNGKIMLYDYRDYSLVELKTDLKDFSQLSKFGNQIAFSDKKSIKIYTLLPN